MTYIIGKPTVELMCGVQSHQPGLMIELTSDKSLIELSHFYYGDDIDEVTQIVGIKPNELQKVIDALTEINLKLKQQNFVERKR